MAADRRRSNPAIPMRGFDASLPMALLRAREAVMEEFRPNLAEHGLTEQQWRVLRALASDPDASAERTAIGIGELADRVVLLGPSLSRIVVTLQERGLVRRDRDDADARRSPIAITDAGLALVRSVAPRAEQIYAAIESRFGAERLARLIAELTELAAQEEAQRRGTGHSTRRRV
jgi:homoprotocatechuate degradation regulator HpaR